MKSIFNLSIIALFSFATVIAGTKEEIINKKLLLDAKKHNIISNNNELIPVSKFRSNSDNRYDCSHKLASYQHPMM